MEACINGTSSWILKYKAQRWALPFISRPTEKKYLLLVDVFCVEIFYLFIIFTFKEKVGSRGKEVTEKRIDREDLRTI